MLWRSFICKLRKTGEYISEDFIFSSWECLLLCNPIAFIMIQAENLKASRYPDESPIPLSEDAMTWLNDE